MALGRLAFLKILNLLITSSRINFPLCSLRCGTNFQFACQNFDIAKAQRGRIAIEVPTRFQGTVPGACCLVFSWNVLIAELNCVVLVLFRLFVCCLHLYHFNFVVHRTFPQLMDSLPCRGAIIVPTTRASVIFLGRTFGGRSPGGTMFAGAALFTVVRPVLFLSSIGH